MQQEWFGSERGLGCSEGDELSSRNVMQEVGEKAPPCFSCWSLIPELFLGSSLLPGPALKSQLNKALIVGAL